MPVTENLVYETATTTGTGNFTLAGAETGFQSFNDAFGTGGSDLFYYFISNEGAAEWEVGSGHLSASTTLVRDTVLASSNSGSAVNFSSGTKNVTSDIPAEYESPTQRADGRLTLTTGTPVLTSDVTAATTIYYTPYKGSRISLYDGVGWRGYEFSELSLSISGFTADTNYDVWVYDNSGTLTLDTTAWTNSTTRATALARQDGVLVKSGTATQRYVGTFRTTGTTGQTEVSFGGSASGADPAWVGIWNMDNRVIVRPWVMDSDASHTYNSTTVRSFDALTTWRISAVFGLEDDWIRIQFISEPETNANEIGEIGIGVDSTTAYSQQTGQKTGSGLSYVRSSDTATYDDQMLGFHFFQALQSANAGTVTFYTGTSSKLSGRWRY